MPAGSDCGSVEHATFADGNRSGADDANPRRHKCGTRRCPCRPCGCRGSRCSTWSPSKASNRDLLTRCTIPKRSWPSIYTSGTTGRPKGVAVTHANVLANIHFSTTGCAIRKAAFIFMRRRCFTSSIFPLMFAAPVFRRCQVTIPKFSPQNFCETVERARVTHTVLVPTMINLLTQFPDLKKYDLSSLEVLAYGGSPMAPELVRRTRELLPSVKLVQVYGLSETGFLTGLARSRAYRRQALLLRAALSQVLTCGSWTNRASRSKPGQPGELVARGANVMRGYWNNDKETSLCVSRWNVSHRRRRLPERRRLFLYPRPVEGHDRHGRRKCLLAARSKRSSTRIRQFAKRRSSEYPIPVGRARDGLRSA